MKELCVANIWFCKTDKKRIIYSDGECETEIVFCLWGKNTESVQRMWQ